MSLSSVPCTIGCDPEIFFVDKNNHVVGSEKVIPNGLGSTNYSKVVLDGVQAEFNVGVTACRQTLAGYIRKCLTDLNQHLLNLRAENKEFSVTFASVVEVGQKEFDSLSPKSKVFGCAPSLNAYNSFAEVGIDGSTYLKRAAGGHIHLGGLPNSIYWDKNAQGASYTDADHRRRLIPILDLLVGNTCVLIDRDMNQVERRQHYGRAGEFRLPVHGVEYRTLSNFWLKDYVLMSFVMALARMGVAILYGTLHGNDYEKALLDKVDFDKVIKAINTNDLDLAYENFEHVKKFVSGNLVNAQYTGFPIQPNRLKRFEVFAKKVQEKGLDHFFPGDPMSRWVNVADNGRGWEHFIDTMPMSIKDMVLGA